MPHAHYLRSRRLQHHLITGVCCHRSDGSTDLITGVLFHSSELPISLPWKHRLSHDRDQGMADIHMSHGARAIVACLSADRCGVRSMYDAALEESDPHTSTGRQMCMATSGV